MDLRRKLASMLVQKRPYYCEVENITSTTNCGINTGIYPQLDSIKIEIKAIKSTAYSLYGENDPSAKFNFTGSGTSAFFRYGISSSGYGSYTPSDVTKAYTFVQDKGTLYIDGVQTGTSATTETATASLPIALYCRFSTDTFVPNDSGVHTIYYCKIWNGGILVRDMIPVLDWNYVPCFYDKISGGLFYNVGSGTLIAGREIHYVDYLEADGTQYINTGLLSTSFSKVSVDFSITDTTKSTANTAAIFGGRVNMTSQTFTYFFIASTTPQYFRFDFNGQEQIGNGNELTINNTSKYRFTYNDITMKTENLTTGESVSLNKGPSDLFTTVPIFIFGVDNGGAISTPFKGKVYHYWYTDGTSSVDMYPAIDENGVGYMFDKVSHTIYDNAGTGVFKYPARETEYIEVTDLGSNNQNPCLNLGLKYVPSMSIESKYTRTAQGVSGSILPLSNNTTMPLVYMPALNGSDMIDRFVWRRTSLPESSYYYNFDSYPMTVEFKVDAVNDALYVNDTLVKSGMIAAMNGYTSPYESASNLYMLSIDGTYGGMGKVYYLKLYNTTQVLRDLIPVWKDGVACMYDKENDVFYSNTKTGTVTCGKILEPYYE